MRMQSLNLRPCIAPDTAPYGAPSVPKGLGLTLLAGPVMAAHRERPRFSKFPRQRRGEPCPACDSFWDVLLWRCLRAAAAVAGGAEIVTASAAAIMPRRRQPPM